MTASGAGRLVSIDEAARSLGVEPAAVRMFVRQRLLRTVAAEPPAIVRQDVARLGRVLARVAGAAATPRG